MDAIIGRYRARMDETGMVLKHHTGISFEFTPEETLYLLDFISVYREALMMTQHDTDPLLDRVMVRRARQEEEDD